MAVPQGYPSQAAHRAAMTARSIDLPGHAPYDGPGAAVYARLRGVQLGVLDALLGYAAEVRATTVLEVGCGTAVHLRALREAVGCACWGVDPSLAMLTRGRADDQMLRLARARAEALPLAAERVDLLYSVDVVHHLQNLGAAYGEMARVLRSGGILVTATDTEATIRARPVLSGYFPETVPHELARYPTIAQLEAAHAHHGLEIIDAFVVEHPYVVTDARPFRERAYSCLYSVSDAALAAGVARLERDLPLATVSRSYVVVARRPIAGTT